MQDQFKCEVSFYVGGAFEYTSHDDLLQLESRLIMALLPVLPRVSLSGLDFKDIRVIPVCDLQGVDSGLSRDPVEEDSLPEAVFSSN